MEFKQAVVTQNGRALMAKLLAGKSTQFTKIKVSSTIYPDAQLANLIALTNIKQETIAQAYGNNTATVSVVGAIENTGLSTGYYINTVGLYAQDPDKGEILYSVSTASVNGYMPPDTGVSKSGFEFKIYTEVGNATQVDLTVDPAAFATHEDLERFKADYYDYAEMDEFLTKILINRKLKLTKAIDFQDKLVEVTTPDLMRYSSSTTLIKPPSWDLAAELNSDQYQLISSKDNSSFTNSTIVNNAQIQIYVEFDLISAVEKNVPLFFESLGVATLSEKVVILKNKVSALKYSVFGYGQSPKGNKLSTTWWLDDNKFSDYHPNHSANKIGEISYLLDQANAFRAITNKGKVIFIIYAEASDGIVNSRVNLDYVSLNFSLENKMSDFYVPRSEYNQEIGEIKDWIQAHS